MKFTIITAFPRSFSFLKESIPKIAQEKNIAEINIVDLKKFGTGRWNKIDDKPFGGGAGMVLQVEPIYKALKNIVPEKFAKEASNSKQRVILTSARGRTWNQKTALDFSSSIDHLVLICGHYEGVDQRVVDNLVDEEISIGNYILSGGELASMVIIDSIVRLLPGVVGNEESIVRETSFQEGYKISEHPHYTRPEVFSTDEGEDWVVPNVLLSGHHKNIEEWKSENSKKVKNA